MVIDIQNEKDFDFFLTGNDNKTILMDFWSNRCEYCRIAAPAVSFIDSEFEQTIITLKIEAERFPYLVSKYNITELPTQIIFYDNNIHCRFRGIGSVENRVNDIKKEIEILVDI